MKRLLTISVFLFLIALILAGGTALLIRRSFPQTSGEVNLPGLNAPVEVLRDASGIPHIYAQDEHDLFMAQGYVHAQDRFWQMDFWRHIGAGRLAEMFGESQVETDAFIRTMGWPRLAEEEWQSADEESRQVLQAYADGVNAYLETHNGSELSFEYVILGLMNSAYEPEPWLPVHSLTWVKAMAWDLGGNMESELRRAVLLPQLGAERLSDLTPSYPAASPVILPDFSLASAPPAAPSASAESLAARGALQRVVARVEALNRLTGGGLAGLGSNNWVVSGSRTTTGAPILANDTHLGIRMPSIWYENGLHCVEESTGCDFEVVGFVFPSLPGVVIGHNDRIAWGVTNNNPDVQDLYLERLNPENPDQYEVNGEWVDMDVREEIIQVAGGQPVTIQVRQTRHGPILSDADEELGGLAESASLSEGAPIAVSLRWTALAPSTISRTLFSLDRAQDFDEFRAALQDWNVPAQNFVYADVDGNIGYQLPGQVPIRRSGDGSFPQPGWTDEAEWTGFIPYDDLPYKLNPESGYIATANNATVGASYPYLLTTQPDLGYRAARIVQLLEGQETFSPGDMRQIHGDTFDPMAPVLTPYLLGLDFHKAGETEDERTRANELKSALVSLDGWDYHNDASSAPAAVFNTVWRHLILRAFGDDLPEGWLPEDDVAFAIVIDLLQRPGDPWWDDLRTPVLETRDEILRLAVADGVEELESRLGRNQAAWSWGRLHGATFRNETLGESGIPPIEALFNRGPYPTGGGASIVNATGWDYEDGYQVAWVPSERMVLDLSDWDAAKAIHTTGQSGHTFHPHYVDMAVRWAQVDYLPLPWTREAVEAQAVESLRLVP
jgi:penicillin amidase